MGFADKLLNCIDCKRNFIYTVEDQEFHASKGFINEPRRCPSCRRIKKNEHTQDANSSENYSSQRQVFSVTCTKCGKATRIPFQPREGKSVYCSNCYNKMRAAR